MKSEKTIEELKERYQLELDRIVKNIRKEKADNVLLQFPEGLKPYATAISDFLSKRVTCKLFIWMGTCFGACDLPNVKKNIDLIVQFGHSDWPYSKSSGIEVIK